MSESDQYKVKAKELAPQHYAGLTNGVTDDMTLGQIEDHVFHISEYLGGMAAVICVIVKNSQPDSAS